MIKASVNQENTYTITREKQQWIINEQPFLWDLIHIRSNHFHIIHQHHSYDIEVVEADYVKKKFKMKINSAEYTIDLQDELDLMLKKLGMNEKKTTGASIIKAPMPGLILHVHVANGDEVQQEAPLVTLEAMKMENVIKASQAGKVKTIKVQQGESVSKNQVLIEMV
jgi:biotin carboxyl carrier protein